MAWNNLFTAIGWRNGDWVTEAKLDDAMENDQYLRENISITPIIVTSVTSLSTVSAISPPTSGSIPIHLTIDGSTELINTSINSSDGVYVGTSDKDTSITATTEGLHAIHSGTGPELWKFVKTQEIEYISIFVRGMWQIKYGGAYIAVGDGDPYNDYLVTRTVEWSIFGHRTAQGW